MAQITVARQTDGNFHVQTPDGASHTVSVPGEYARQWMSASGARNRPGSRPYFYRISEHGSVI
jgi:hypothetical protein